VRHVRYFLLGAVAMLVIGTYAYVRRPVPLPDVALGIDPQCIEAMRRPPDLTWVSPGGATYRPDTTIAYGQLTGHGESLVRVAGVLRLEFEGVQLYRSFEHVLEAYKGNDRATWVDFSELWPQEPEWLTRSPYVSDRCAAVEGRVVPGRGGHMGSSNGTIRRVTRLEVWAMPHRPPAPPDPPTPATGASGSDTARFLVDLRRRLDADGPHQTLVDLMARADAHAALVRAMGAGGRDGLLTAHVLWPVADAHSRAALRRGLQEATATNTLNVVHAVADGAFDQRDACRTDALPPNARWGEWATVYDILRIDQRIAKLQRITDASVAPVAQRCIDELRRERDEVLATAAAGSEPWRPRPGR